MQLQHGAAWSTLKGYVDQSPIGLDYRGIAGFSTHFSIRHFRGGKPALARILVGFETGRRNFIFFVFAEGLSMCPSSARKRAGLTLLRSLALLIVLASVIGVTVTAVLKARREADRQATVDNLGKCAKAVHLAHDRFKKFPPYFGVYGAKMDSPLPFHAHLLPFVDQVAVYNNPMPDAIVPSFLASMDPTQTDSGAGAANFPVNLRLFYTNGGDGVLATNPQIYPKMPGTFPDGVSTKLLFATKYMHCGNGGSRWLDSGNNAIDSVTAATFGANMGLWQKAPTREACNPKAGTAVSLKPDGIHVAMCDASVRFVSNAVDAKTWADVHTPASHEPWPGWGDGS